MLEAFVNLVGVVDKTVREQDVSEQDFGKMKEGLSMGSLLVAAIQGGRNEAEEALRQLREVCTEVTHDEIREITEGFIEQIEQLASVQSE